MPSPTDEVVARLDLIEELLADRIRFPVEWRPQTDGVCTEWFSIPIVTTGIRPGVRVQLRLETLVVDVTAADGTVLWRRVLRVEWVPTGQPWMPAIPPNA